MRTRGVLLAVLALAIAFASAPAIAQDKPQHVVQDAAHKVVPAKVIELLPADVPLPPDIVVHPPEPEIDAKLAGFSGIWTEEWKFASFRGLTSINHILAVERIQPNGATIVYAWGNLPLIPEATAWRPGWVRVFASFLDGSMIVNFPRRGATVTYKMNGDGTITGAWVGSYVAHTTLRKVASENESTEYADRPSVVQAAERTDGTDEALRPLIGKWRRVMFSVDTPVNIITITGTHTDKTPALEGAFWTEKLGKMRLSAENVSVSIEKDLIKLEVRASWYADYELTYYRGELVGTIVPKGGPYIGQTMKVLFRKE